MESFESPGCYNNVTCPFCGLLCDDLSINSDQDNQLTVAKAGCQKSTAFFGYPSINPGARVQGRHSDLKHAIQRAAEILRQSRLPLIAGLGTEVQGMRAIMHLADATGATIDHMNAEASMRNLQVIQNSGWQTCTLTEVRNRVDLLLVIGTDIVSQFPRFFERVIWNKDSMFGQDTSRREVVYLGGRNLNTAPGTAPDGRQADTLPCDMAQLPEVIAALRALLRGKSLSVTQVAGIAVPDLHKLAARLKAAQYSVVAWSAAAFNFAQAELTVQNISELVKELNQTTRSNGLPLGGADGDMSANQVSAWISGYPVRTSYARTYPEHDPYHFATDRLLANGEADSLVWVSSFDPQRTPPPTALPTVVLGHAHMKLEREPEVFIPVGLPGADHPGFMFRMDNVVSLPLAQLRHSKLPDLASVLAAIEKEITHVD